MAKKMKLAEHEKLLELLKKNLIDIYKAANDHSENVYTRLGRIQALSEHSLNFIKVIEE